MDLLTRKFNAIQYLINLQDEKLFNKIERTILNSRLEEKQILKPFTKKQLIERASKSNKDYVAGKVKTQQQLELESEKW
jgi:hypothetical protein